MTLVLTIGPATPPSTYILGLILPFPIAVAIAIVSAMLLALIVGAIALRHLRGIYFSIVTLGAVYVLYVFAGQFVPLFNGYNGLSGFFDPMGDFFGLDFSTWPFFYLGFCVVILIVVLVMVTRLSGSRSGSHSAACARTSELCRLRPQHLCDEAQGICHRRRHRGVGRRVVRRVSQRFQPVRVVTGGNHRPVCSDPRRRPGQQPGRHPWRRGDGDGVAGGHAVPP